MAKPRKEQLHNMNLQLWNFKGANDFSEFAPVGVLSNDVWVCNAASNVSLDSGLVIIRPGDMVLALIDSPGNLTHDNIVAGKWKIIKNITDDEVEWIEGQMYTAPTFSLSGVTSSYLRFGYDSAPAVNVGYSVTKQTEDITGIKIERIVGGVPATIFEDMSSPALTGSVATTVALNQNTTFKLTVYTATRSFDTSVLSSWYYECFQGVYAGTSLNEASLEGLTGYNAAGTSNINKSGTFNCANPSDHWFFAVPEAINPVSPDYLEFLIQNLVTELTTVADVARTIGSGTTPVNYKIYRTPNPGVGSRSYVVTYKNV